MAPPVRVLRQMFRRRVVWFSVLGCWLGWISLSHRRIQWHDAPTLSNLEIQEDVLAYIDPFIGTGGDGHTFPGPSAPFGKIQPSPDNGVPGWSWTSGYHISSNVIFGFSNTHLSGTGIADLMDVTMMPFCLNREEMGSRGFEEHLQHVLTNPVESKPGMKESYSATFNTSALRDLLISNISHEAETAEPGYYSVLLKRHNISVELTASTDVGMHRYTLLGEENAMCDEHIVAIDLSTIHFIPGRSTSGLINVIESTDTSTPGAVEGYRVVDAWARERRLHYRIEFSEEILDHVVFNNSNGTFQWNGCVRSGCNVAFLKFDNFHGLLARISVSSVGVNGARMALDRARATHGFDFHTIQQSTKSLWRDHVSKIRVFGGNTTLKRVFYTAMYHAMLAPGVHSDPDGSFRGPDQSIHTAPNHTYYSTLSIWDTFRAHYSLLTILDRNVARDVAMTLLTHASLFKDRLPVWALAGQETDTMPGYHAVSFLAEALQKGLLGHENLENILRVVNKTAQTNSHIRVGEHIDVYGYVPSDLTSESVSKTLEFAYDDWCIAEIAKLAGHQQMESYYRNRSRFYRNVFDEETRFMRPRTKDGKFVPDFDPSYSEHETGAFTEGTGWQFLWFVPQDIEDLFNLLGGRKAAEHILDSFFFPDSDSTIHGSRSSIDITGLIGHYAHGNEPGHHNAYIFNILGSPKKTQYLTRKILRTMYSPQPDGLIGNDDCGQMSAWFILSSIGLYPFNPSDATYQITSPLFERTEIMLSPSSHINSGSDENRFVIDAPGASSHDYMYISQAILYRRDGSRARTVFSKNTGSLIISHEEVMAGGRLYLEMMPMHDSPF